MARNRLDGEAILSARRQMPNPALKRGATKPWPLAPR